MFSSHHLQSLGTKYFGYPSSGGDKGWHVFYHFVGAVPGSTELEIMLRRLLREMDAVNVSEYHQTSNISHSLVCNKLTNHSDVVGASPVGAAPTTSSFST